MTTATSRSSNTDIECLRALAVIGVMIHHAQGNLFHPGLPLLDRIFAIGQTWCGVDLFFAISGFVIARSLLPQLATVSGSLAAQCRIIAAFWIRRAWRLLPSAWLWLVVMLLASMVANRSGVFQSVHANLIATLAGFFNVANIRYADSFYQYPYGASFVYWSLSLEEQFYVVLPLLAACTRRYFPWILAALLAIQLPMHRSILAMAFRTDALGLGVLLAVVSKTTLYAKVEPRVLARVRGSGGLILALLLSLTAVLAVLNEKHSSFAIGGIAIATTALVWIASYDANYLIRQSWLKRGLTWIGNRSYAIYLCHIPIFFLLREFCFRFGLEHPSAWLLGATAACLIALVAEMNFRYVEQPLRHHGRQVANRFSTRHQRKTDSASDAPVRSPPNESQTAVSA
ncbi:acyltransferase [Dyella acidisoli]